MPVQLRVERTDGSLEPPITIDNWVLAEDLPKESAVGSLFALDDGRWVQVIGHARAGDGTLQHVVVGEIPEQRSYSASGHEIWVRDPHEMRMGSQQYGTLILDSEPLQVGSVDEASPIWSADGRYLAVAVLESWQEHPVTQVVVIDADRRAQVASSNTVAGLLTPEQFVGRSLRYRQKRLDLEGAYRAHAFLRF